MNPQDKIDRTRRFVAEIWNNGNIDAVDDLFAKHCSFHDPSFPVNGTKGLRDQVRELRAAYPDLHIDLHDVIAEGDMTASRWTMGGTAKGEFRGFPATGKTYVMTGMNFAKWESDRIVESWTNYDLLGALQQTGIIPEMAQMGTSS